VPAGFVANVLQDAAATRCDGQEIVERTRLLCHCSLPDGVYRSVQASRSLRGGMRRDTSGQKVLSCWQSRLADGDAACLSGCRF
jgi:hypothetical protein